MIGSGPILVLSKNTQRESGRKVQLGNISAAKTIADVIRTCLGPRSMLKMLMDPMGGIVMTNDGNAILREIQVKHPAAKSMIEISRTQDEEVGDGTTSVIILAGEMLAVAEPLLEEQMHPTVIIRGYRQALDDMVEYLKEKLSTPMDVKDREQLKKVINSTVGTKFLTKWSELACQIAMEAVKTVHIEEEGGYKEIDIKRYAKVEKVPGGSIEESCVLQGVMINKDVTHPKMRRHISNPRIMLLDCPLEYKKGESMTNMEFSQEADFSKALQMEEESVQKMCAEIIAVKPDVVITEKGVSDLAQHFLMKAGITAVRRVRKTDNNRMARATGATIVNRTDEVKEEDIGTRCGLFDVKKMGDEYFMYLVDCSAPKACTILLRGASKDVLNEVERNLQDAMSVARNITLYPRLVPGGGAVEMACAQYLSARSKSVVGMEQYPYRAVARALEVIPRTLIQNCGGNTIRTLTQLRARHAAAPAAPHTTGPAAAGPGVNYGINGEDGGVVDMAQYGIWEPLAVKLQVYKTAIETAVLLLRIDDIVSGTKKGAPPAGGDMEG